MNFPASLDTSATLPNPTTSSTTNSPSHAGLHASENAAIIAVETKLGSGSSTPASNTLLIGTGTGTSSWSALTSSQLASVLSDETGSGSAVFANTPTLITPKVDTINENTTSNGVTVGGVNLKSGVITTAGAVGTTAIVAGAVTPDKLATGAATASVTTSETSATQTYADLTTTTDTVTVTIGAKGLALISLYSQVSVNAASSNIFAAFAISGATTQAATDSLALHYATPPSGASWTHSGSATFLLTGLTAGSTTFKMKYRVDSNTGTWGNRRIAVVPL